MDRKADFISLDDPEVIRKVSPDCGLLESSAREYNVVEEIHTSSSNAGIDSLRPAHCARLRGSSVLHMNGRALTDPKSRKNLSRHAKSSCLNSTLGQENIISQQTRVTKENGKSEVMIYVEEQSPFPLQVRDMKRKKDKGLERKNMHFSGFSLVGSSISNRSLMRLHDWAEKSSKEDKEVSFHFDVDLETGNEEKGIVLRSDMQDKSIRDPLRPQYRDSTVKNRGKGKSIMKDNNLENTVYADLLDGVASYDVPSPPPDYEYSLSDKNKGKKILEDDNSGDVPHIKPQIQPNRSSSVWGEELIIIADDKSSSFGSCQNMDLREAHDVKESTSSQFSSRAPSYKNELSSYYLPQWRDGIDGGDSDHAGVVHKSSGNSRSYHRSNPPHDSQAFTDRASRRHHNRKKRGKGRRKSNLLYNNYSEELSSVLDQRLPCPQVQVENSNMRHRGNCHGPCLEVGQYSQETRWNSPPELSIEYSDNSNARANQVESDERLARELQEQFYCDMRGFNDTERVDAAIAWSLQKDEDTEAATYSARQGQSNARESPNSRNQPSSLFWNYSSHLTDHTTAPLRRNPNYIEMFPQMAVFDELRRNFPNEMDLETRLDILEAMEEMLENSGMLESDDSNYYHDFNENDYETLLTLDNIHQDNGASESRINRLPLSVVKIDKNEDACSVCLETPSVGETMRLLPCLHKFHKECIDTWLKRRPLCPVCKSNIT